MPVTFNPFTGNLDLLGEVDASSAQTITNKTLGNTREATGTITDGAAVEIDLAGPGFQSWSLSATRTATIGNVEAGRQVKISVTSNGHGLTLTGVNWGDAGLPELGLVTDIELWSDNGSTVKGALAWRAVTASYTFEVTTTAPNTVFTLRTADAVNYDVDWGDGESDAGVTSNALPHTYAAADTYTVTVESVAPFRFHANGFPDNLLVTAVIGASDGFPWRDIFEDAWQGCSNLTSFPPLDLSNGTSFLRAWYDCSNLTSFPLLDVSSGTDFSYAWYACSNLTSFPLLNVSSGTDFRAAWSFCSSLTSFPPLDASSGTSFREAWQGCSGLTSFSLLDVSSGTDFRNAWRDCSSLTSFPPLDASSGTNFFAAWRNCTGLTSFSLLDVSSGTNFGEAWKDCSSLTDFPAGFFDSWTGTLVGEGFIDTWVGCTSLSATSVENILNSIDASGQSAPPYGVEIMIDYNASSGTPNIAQAVTNLKSRGWEIILNGAYQ